MKSREEIIKEIRESSNGSWDDMITEGFEAGIKYAQQSQPSPAGAAEGEFTLSFCDKCIQMTNHKLVCQKCKPASEGISKIREVMNWISQCVDEDHDLEVSEIKMIWNDLSDAISLIESTPHSSEGMAEALRKVQIGESAEADFDRNLWSFEMPDNYSVNSGSFAIVPLELYKQFLASLLPASDEG